MKRKFSKFLGVGLALMLVLGFSLVPAAPVSAVGGLTGVSVTVTDPEVDATTTHTVYFTTVSSIPNEGRIVITYPVGIYPAGFDVSGVDVIESSIDGGFLKSFDGNEITLTRDDQGTPTIGSTAEWIKLGVLTNTQDAGDYTVDVATQLANGDPIDSGTSTTFTIIPGPKAALAFVDQPSETVAGAVITPAVTVEIVDEFGNRTTDEDTIDIALLDDPGTLLGDVDEVASAGLATFGNMWINLIGEGYTLQATLGALNSDTSDPFNIILGTKSELNFVQEPTDTVAGQTISPVTVEILDDYGNRTLDTDEITIAIFQDPGGGTLSGTTTVAAVDGLATFDSLSIDKVGEDYNLEVTSGSLVPTDSAVFDITPGLPVALAFVQQPTTTGAGQTIPPVTVEILDALGNRTLDTDEITIAILNNPGEGTLSGTTTVAAVAGLATFGLSIDKAGVGYTLEATSGDLTPYPSAPFNITLGPPVGIAFVEQPSDTVAWEYMVPPVTVEVIDAGGNRVHVETIINITLLANPGGGALDGVMVPGQVVDGLATFPNLRIDKIGVGYILLADLYGTPGNQATSDPFNITPAEKVALAFVQQPTTTGAGQAITPAVTVEIVDAHGNRTLDTDEITIVVATGLGELLGTTTVAAMDGLATFSDLSIEVMGTGYTLVAFADGWGQVYSEAFDITVGTAAALAFVDQPTTTVAGETIPTVTVEILDAYGNQTTATDTITIAILNNPSEGGLGELSGTFTIAASDGLATFSTLSIDKTGVGYTLKATAVELTEVTSGEFDITPAAKVGLAFVQEPTETVAGETIADVTVKIVDAYGNRTLDEDDITIAILFNPGTGELSGTTTVAAVAGLATFDDLWIDKTGRLYTLEATAGGVLAPATSAAFHITPAAAFAIAVTADPTSIAVGLTSAITATVTDAYGNHVVKDTVISFETTLGLVSPVTGLTENGVAKTTLSAGSLSGMATVTATAVRAGVSGEATVEFTAAVIDNITIVAEPMFIPADGISQSTITVTLVDEHGNTVPTAGATVSLETTAGNLDPESGVTVAGIFTSTLTSSTPPADATVTVNVGGVFSGSVTVDFYPPLEPNQIRLQEGWNAISLPLIPNNPLIEVVLAEVKDNIEIVWAYDPALALLLARPDEPWFSYIPDPEAPTPDLTEMKDGLGYWVKMSEGADAKLTISGVVQPLPPQLPKTYPVVAGWNFIGFKSLNPMLYDAYLVNISGSYSVIWGYSDGDFYDVYPLLHRPYLTPGSGYWIWMTDVGIIVPPGE